MSGAARYRAIFHGVESALVRAGNQKSRSEDIRNGLDAYRELSQKTFLDADYYRLMVHIAFYSGMKVVLVEKKLDVIDRVFSTYSKVAEYGPDKVDTIRLVPGMIGNRAKIRACVENARQLKEVVRVYGSFSSYIESFRPSASFENVMKLRANLRERFAYLGKVTSYHFLTDIGMQVVKPDRVLRRIFHRLGFLEDVSDSEQRLEDTVRVGQEFARATGHPIRYVDIVFVAFGQVEGNDPDSLPQGICLGDAPQCRRCDVTDYCGFRGIN